MDILVSLVVMVPSCALVMLIVLKIEQPHADQHNAEIVADNRSGSIETGSE